MLYVYKNILFYLIKINLFMLRAKVVKKYGKAGNMRLEKVERL